jgi:mannose/fructose/N-acetylgalactosamine-specific phosphotransferase system component IID
MTVADYVGLVATILAILGIMGGGLVWLVRNVVRDEIAKATKSIQPGYRNGGQSLADLSHKVDQLIAHVGMDK